MNWDGKTRTVVGLVPVTKITQSQYSVVAIDPNGMTASSNFYINFISKPYLA